MTPTEPTPSGPWIDPIDELPVVPAEAVLAPLDPDPLDVAE